TCWLGGTFTRSSFARKIHASSEEHMPAVTAVGYVADAGQARKGLLRRATHASSRLAWETLFFDQAFGVPLSRENAEEFVRVLDLVRLAPSASNKQPWRLVKDDRTWHFYLKRTPGYPGSFVTKLLGTRESAFPDIQRVDMGIAVCHFDLASREMGLTGTWVVEEPTLPEPPALTEYVASFVG
ncbi:nitroreductase, partial [Candidatus Bipolaricaulota bacterium]|nr:nitroreductase [Candidatus Bipolaricaulota bacterium]